MYKYLTTSEWKQVRSGDEEGGKRVLREKFSANAVLDKAQNKARVNYELAAKLASKIGEERYRLQWNDVVVQMFCMIFLVVPCRWQAECYFTSVATSWWCFGKGRWGNKGSSFWIFRRIQRKNSQGIYYFLERGHEVCWRSWQQISSNEIQASSLDFHDLSDESPLTQYCWVLLPTVLPISRLVLQAEESIQAAQERLRRQDAEFINYISGIMARYRRGDLVSEEELELAFKQLERRF